MSTIRGRLEYLRSQIENECISTAEILELESLAKHIDPGDVLLLEWAGVPEHRDTDKLSRKAEKAARRAEKAIKRARRALKKYINGDEDLAELVSGCYEGYPVDDMEEGARNMRELGNTLMYVRENHHHKEEPVLDNHIPADIALAIYNTHRTTGLAGMPGEVQGIFLEMEHNGGLIIHGNSKKYRLTIEEAGE